jgi:hypothetical protein
MTDQRSVIPWSWSTLEAYQTCPRAFYETKIAKNFKYPDNEQLIWGNEVHTALELRVGQAVPLPNNMLMYEPMATKLANAPGKIYCELETAVNSSLESCGFWDEDCWNRGYEDYVCVNGNKALTLDYKTGKVKPRSRQLDLSAMRIFAMFPEVDVVHSAFAYLQFNKWVRGTFYRKDYNDTWASFYPLISDMIWSEENNAWPAKPSGLCKRSRRAGSSYMGCPVATCPHSEYYRK